jgi:hypothetical protein
MNADFIFGWLFGAVLMWICVRIQDRRRQGHDRD